MSEAIRELLELAAIDKGLLSCKQRLRAGPAEVERLEAEVARAQEAGRAAEDGIRRLAADADRVTLDIRSAETERSDQEKKIQHVKNNREYRIVTDRLKELADLIADKENALLAAMEAMDKAKAVLEERRAAVAEAREALERRKAELNGELKAVRAEAMEFRARRDPQIQKLNRLDAALFPLYDAALHRTRGDALAEMDNGICQACFQRQNPSVIDRVVVGREIKECRCQGCGRILYPRVRVGEEPA